MSEIDSLMRLSPVIPVLVVEDAAVAMPLATALVAGGLRVLEVTLRTPAAFEVIREMTKVPGAVVGAGTVLNARDLDAAMSAGAGFIVSPGLTESLAKAAAAAAVPFLPGVATAGDIMRGLDLGLGRFKFFPAEAAGGVKALKSLIGPFGRARFCPTGGVGLANLEAWLSIPEVLCVGGSWLYGGGPVDQAAVQAGAEQAVAIARRSRDGLKDLRS